MSTPANIALLEMQKTEAEARRLVEMGTKLATSGPGFLGTRLPLNNPNTKLSISTMYPALKRQGLVLKQTAGDLMSGDLSRTQISEKIRNVIIEVGKAIGRPHNTWAYWWDDVDPNNPNYSFAQALPSDFKDLIRQIHRASSEFSTQLQNTSKMYKTGSIGHGILHVLSTNPARHWELIAYFPTISGASTMTHMRRQGVVAKEDDDNLQSPFVLTELGVEILKARGAYTFAMWKKYRGTPGATRLPWEDPKDRERYLKRTKLFRFAC